MSDGVLIVDDSLTIRMDLADTFGSAGFRPRTCASVAEARRNLSAEIAAIVLDVRLPDGDGVDLLAELRATAVGAAAVIVMLSSESEVKDRVRALQTGADEYVGKPYDGGYLVARVRELLRARNGEPRRAHDVLVIDDSPSFREALRETLAAEGYQVLAAANGEDGLRIAADRRPAAMIVDGMLPGIDGVTVIRRVRFDAALRGIPCLLLTADEDVGAELRALDAGADAFARKDADLDVVRAKLAAMLRHVADAPVSVGALGPRKILAVDDSPTYLEAVAGALRGDGYEVALARSGEEALELLSVDAVDCILLDVVMPGLGGKETCRRIKQAPIARDIPLILLTAIEDRAAMLEGLAVGADDYIAKSSELDVLKARIRAQIRRKQFEDENRRIRDDLLRREVEAAEQRAAREVAETRAAVADELARTNLELAGANRELEAFSYTVSHDLRTPLRAVGAFAAALAEDYGDRLDEVGRDYLHRVLAASARMSDLVEALLELSRIGRVELGHQRIDLSALVESVLDELRTADPARAVTAVVAPGMVVAGDLRLIRNVFDNLLGNAWKFTAKVDHPRIEVGVAPGPERAIFVRDNGAGFDMTTAAQLFTPFIRLHADSDFRGTGIGLATVRRIVERHGGRIWADAAVGRGATISFTLPDRGALQ